MVQSSFLEKDSPVDFLYLDRNRLSSLIGQLSDRGMLVGLRSVLGKVEGREGTAGGSIAVAKAEGKVNQSHSESTEETYDPFWTHAYSFLRDLELNFAVPLTQARLGSLVKFEAFIQFLDLKIMRDLWEPSAQAFLHTQNQANSATSTRKQRRASTQQSTMPSELKFGLEVLKRVPHLLHLTFVTREGLNLWAAAQPSYLTITSEDLVMKYGATIDGLWTVVGIVDGMVGPSPDPVQVNPIVDGAVTAMTAFRDLIGRPRDQFGLTPIAVYAPIQGVAESEVEAGSGS